jgi:uncharacterized membrane-anchored protein YhcB (DUF1043 family)
MSDMVLSLDYALPLLLLIALGAFFLGRKTGSGAARVRGLEGELTAAREEATRLQEDLDGYRGRVTEHFAETSQRLHDLTLQYRAVYDHLAKGANELCPEGFQKLEGGLGLDALPEGSAADRADEADEVRDRPESGPASS